MASEDAAPPNESDKSVLSTEEDNKPKKRIACCIDGESCRKGKELAVRAKAKNEAKVEAPNRLDVMEEKRVRKTLRAIRQGLQVAENEKVMRGETFESLENFTRVALEIPPAKRVFLGVMGWEQAEKTLTKKGKRIGLYFKMEKIKNIDVLEEELPRFVLFRPHGSDDLTHYRIVHRIVKDRDEYVVEDGSDEAQMFPTLSGVDSHYEKISCGTNLVV